MKEDLLFSNLSKSSREEYALFQLSWSHHFASKISEERR